MPDFYHGAPLSGAFRGAERNVRQMRHAEVLSGACAQRDRHKPLTAQTQVSDLTNTSACRVRRKPLTRRA
ncbi:hypothetical protein, partial [Bacteroides heparinolyticus]|uniref:hypothetical protein n=1 Tax=Prevotella heparinolytica TaxID=28113 RepID=UPI00359FD99C